MHRVLFLLYNYSLLDFSGSFAYHDDVIKWNLFHVTGPLWGEFTGDQWIPLTKASDAELLCIPLSAPEQTIEWKIETPVIWDAIASIMISL